MSTNFYIHCDELDKLPKANKDNWLFELELLVKLLTPNATVLQVGCMDGTRIIKLLSRRPDLKVTGLDIDEGLLEVAKRNFDSAGIEVKLVESDITKPHDVGWFDYVLCLNNTLGYISKERLAVKNMKLIGKTTVLSVYGEKFSDSVGISYFKSLGLVVNKIENDTFHTESFGAIRRFRLDDVSCWGGEIINTPLGYFCIISR